MIKTRTVIGKGTLIYFQEAYNLIQDKPECEVISSQLFPSGTMNVNSNAELTEVYEWVIYYRQYLSETKKVEPVKKQITLAL